MTDTTKERAKTTKELKKSLDRSENRDPITHEHGAHPVGTGTGAVGGAAAGATMGAVAGPIGAAIGGTVGAVLGGLAGKEIAEEVNPTIEDAYWRENYATRPYAKTAVAYEIFRPAYQHGWEARARYAGRHWDEIEPQLRADWENNRDESALTWDEAGPAALDAWTRLTQ